MKRLILFAAVLYLVAPATALPAPKAESSAECWHYFQIATFSAAMAKNGVARPTVEKVLADVFYASTPDARTIMRLIVDAAFSGALAMLPSKFAKALAQTCMRNKGDMDGILGTGI